MLIARLVGTTQAARRGGRHGPRARRHRRQRGLGAMLEQVLRACARSANQPGLPKRGERGWDGTIIHATDRRRLGWARLSMEKGVVTRGLSRVADQPSLALPAVSRPTNQLPTTTMRKRIASRIFCAAAAAAAVDASLDGLTGRFGAGDLGTL